MQKISIHIKKYIPYVLGVALLVSCEQDAIEGPAPAAPLPALSAGSLNLSNYVSLGNSLTAGITDGALFKKSQELSMPNLLAQKFVKAGGGSFSQPMMNDNNGGLLLAGNMIAGPRLFFDGAGPASLLTANPAATPTTDIATNNPTGPFNNMGVPGAKSYHLLAPGFGNISNVALGLANPYFVRMASSPNTSVLADAMAQAPTFFSLWIGNNDALGHATSGADGNNPLTELDTFDFAYNTLVSTLTSNGAKGIVANIPYLTSLPHFTTVPHNPLDPENPAFGPQIATLNGIFGQLNQVFDFLGVPERKIIFSETENSEVVIRDESLTDLSAQIASVLSQSPTFPLFVQSFGLPAAAAPLVANLLGATYGQAREATSEDLFVLPSSAVIGTVNEDATASLVAQGLPLALAGQFSAEGITLPLADKWVLTPQEQAEIKTAIDGYNNIIKTAATAAGLAHLDANAYMQQLATTGITDGQFTVTANLVTGGVFSLDGVHPNPRGYALLSNLMMKTLDATFGSNFEASGNLLDIGDYPTNFSPAMQ